MLSPDLQAALPILGALAVLILFGQWLMLKSLTRPEDG